MNPIRLSVIMRGSLLAAMFPCLCWGEAESEVLLQDGATDQIEWGQHWAGPRLNNTANLRGKVVLLQIWGNCDRCQEITPGMVSLAKKHEGEPFHLIASYCQPGEKRAALETLRSNGWSEDLANLSVMRQTRYPIGVDVQPAPHYLLFDHTGRLRYHHFAGSPDEGSGDTCQQQVADLLKEIPKPGNGKAALSDLRSWANAQGKLIEASLLGVRDGRAKFQMRNGRTYEYPLDKLSEGTRKEIEALLDGAMPSSGDTASR